MLEVQNLTIQYGTGRNLLNAVDGVSFALPRGGTLGLVGESGSGKSTIARGLLGLAPLAAGRVTLDGADVSSEAARTTKAYRRRVQMVFQDPYGSLNPRMTVGEMLGEAVAIRGHQSRKERRAEALQALEHVGLSVNALTRYPHQFSGGQRQRVAIARALAVGPEVIVMDEVTSALDVSIQATILNLLTELQRELNLSYLFISHDLSVVSTMSDMIAVMYLGQIVECAASEKVFADPQHPYTQALIDSVPQFAGPRVPLDLTGQIPDPRDPPSGCRFHSRCPIGPRAFPNRTICVENDPQVQRDERPHLSACHFAGDNSATAPDHQGQTQPA